MTTDPIPIGRDYELDPNGALGAPTANPCECGHDRTEHIYHEGACRPGYVCPAACREFRPRNRALGHQPGRYVVVATVPADSPEEAIARVIAGHARHYGAHVEAARLP